MTVPLGTGQGAEALGPSKLSGWGEAFAVLTLQHWEERTGNEGFKELYEL